MRLHRSPWIARLGRIAAAVLLLLAIWVAGRGVDLGLLAGLSWPALGLLAGGGVVNLVATGLLFWAVTRSFDADPPVGPLRMTQLIAASALLNYLPLIRAGLLGRTAYLKARHGLPVRQSVLVLAVVMVLAAVVSAGALLAIVPASAAIRWGLAGLATLIASVATGPIARAALRRPILDGWMWVPLRVVDLLAAAGRLWLAFQMIGLPIGYDQAVVMGAASLLVKLAGVTPSGLGLSEWVVAGLAAALAPVSTAQGMVAALVDRGVEVVVVGLCGLIAVACLHRGGTRGGGRAGAA